MADPWTPCGYPPATVFPGWPMCRFRLAHKRDGIAVITLGHQVAKGGRLEPVQAGFNFVTFVIRMVDEADGEVPPEVERAACQDWRTATAQHQSLLNKYATEDAP